jgi:hypothetical protein
VRSTYWSYEAANAPSTKLHLYGETGRASLEFWGIGETGISKLGVNLICAAKKFLPTSMSVRRSAGMWMACVT